jgi:pimeloyl-ACP methyl ester carboxylesterase
MALTRRAKRGLWAGFVLLAAFAVFVSWASFGPPDPARAFEGRPAPVEGRVALGNGRELRFFETGLEHSPLVLFVHGSPGAWNDFAHVMADDELAARAKLVAVDRLGWGGSAMGGLAPTMAEQAHALAQFLRERPADRPVVVVGHSLGGPVAARLAMDAPDLVDALVLVAASVDPQLETPTWYQHVGRTRLVRAILPEVLRRADDEIEPLRPELEALLPLWPKLRLPIFVQHGDDDALVPPANVDFVARIATGAPLSIERMPDQGHLIPWERPDALSKLVQRALDAALESRERR